MIAIQIKTELIEWVQERLGLDADEAQNFAEEFAGMLYFSGGFSAEDGRSREAAPVMLTACEAARRYVGELMVNESNYRPAVDILHQLDAAIAAAKPAPKADDPYLARYDYAGDMREE